MHIALNIKSNVFFSFLLRPLRSLNVESKLVNRNRVIIISVYCFKDGVEISTIYSRNIDSSHFTEELLLGYLLICVGIKHVEKFICSNFFLNQVLVDHVNLLTGLSVN